MTDSISPAADQGVNQADYLKLFMQELTYQDPLKPVDNREFMAQMAQISSLQEARTTNDSLIHLMRMTEANQTLMLLGKQVKIQGDTRSGVVSQIQFPDKSAPQLMITFNGVPVIRQLTDITDVL